ARQPAVAPAERAHERKRTYKCALSRGQPIHKTSIAFLSCKQYTSFVEQLVIKKGVIKMSESTEEIKKMEARIAKLDEQQKQLKA
ncbi:hypothetical protein, partial [Lactiplantibacillus paraplantarum]|uniref:hypothetical protein n=1 Tax=Lactiplantibacillus paraplantarum TaxID=60520 RepID=UPI002551F266